LLQLNLLSRKDVELHTFQSIAKGLIEAQDVRRITFTELKPALWVILVNEWPTPNGRNQGCQIIFPVKKGRIWEEEFGKKKPINGACSHTKMPSPKLIGKNSLVNGPRV